MTDTRSPKTIAAANGIGQDAAFGAVAPQGGPLSAAQLEYAARDAQLMLPLRLKLVEALRANALTRKVSTKPGPVPDVPSCRYILNSASNRTIG